MPRPAKYANDEERRAADAERKRRARAVEQTVDETLPERQVDEPDTSDPKARSILLILRLDPSVPLLESEEQMLRDYYGYSPSETRSRAERAGVAARLGAPARGLDLASASKEDLKAAGLWLEKDSYPDPSK